MNTTRHFTDFCLKIRSRAGQASLILMMTLIGFSSLPEPFLPIHFVRLREVLKRTGMNRADYEANERGYYEALLDTNRSLGGIDGGAMVEFPKTPPPNMHGQVDGRPILPVDDIREYVLMPSVDIVAYDTIWQTNSLGLRDREYDTSDDDNGVRIAVLGDSITCGWGVKRQERFEDLWETHLNQVAAENGKKVQVWNFAVPGHAPGQRWKHFETVGKDLKVDLVVFEATTSDPGWDARRMAHFMSRNVGLDDPLYAGFMAASDFRPTTSPKANGEMLKPWSWSIVQGVYERIVEGCHEKGIPVAYVLIPRVGSNLSRPEILALLARARSAGFDYVVDISGIYDGNDPEDLALRPGDHHPNVTGHAMLAKAWTEKLDLWPELQASLSQRSDRK